MNWELLGICIGISALVYLLLPRLRKAIRAVFNGMSEIFRSISAGLSSVISGLNNWWRDQDGERLSVGGFIRMIILVVAAILFLFADWKILSITVESILPVEGVDWKFSILGRTFTFTPSDFLAFAIIALEFFFGFIILEFSKFLPWAKKFSQRVQKAFVISAILIFVAICFVQGLMASWRVVQFQSMDSNDVPSLNLNSFIITDQDAFEGSVSSTDDSGFGEPSYHTSTASGFIQFLNRAPIWVSFLIAIVVSAGVALAGYGLYQFPMYLLVIGSFILTIPLHIVQFLCNLLVLLLNWLGDLVNALIGIVGAPVGAVLGLLPFRLRDRLRIDKEDV
jgi:hypothetical protein